MHVKRIQLLTTLFATLLVLSACSLSGGSGMKSVPSARDEVLKFFGVTVGDVSRFSDDALNVSQQSRITNGFRSAANEIQGFTETSAYDIAKETICAILDYREEQDSWPTQSQVEKFLADNYGNRLPTSRDRYEAAVDLVDTGKRIEDQRTVQGIAFDVAVALACAS
jgi:hypothetical protein